eukprot:TRINITY_DN5039_c0_g1_i1.p1 TRINITY_DN5039_c0_g1~~TRINITY_DN5039_c0_g1_i1.p1  ORF type:complete len:207 (+),score=24.51 TRINITY_DN5039_c0_g1_i1:26-646(+)
MESPENLEKTDRKKKNKKKNDKEEKGLVIPANYKTQLCRNWEEEKRCPYGKRCVFAHDLCELRTIQINLVAMAHVAYLRSGQDAYGRPVAGPEYYGGGDPYGSYYPMHGQPYGEYPWQNTDYSQDWAQYYAQFGPAPDIPDPYGYQAWTPPPDSQAQAPQDTSATYFMHDPNTEPDSLSKGPRATGELADDDVSQRRKRTYSAELN